MNYEEFCAALQEELFNMLDTGYFSPGTRSEKQRGRPRLPGSLKSRKTLLSRDLPGDAVRTV